MDTDNKPKKIFKRSKADSNKLRQDILDIAERKFKEIGYKKTTLQSIAKELNITDGAIHYHYKFKNMVLYDFFRKLYDLQFDYIEANPPENYNKYLLYCIVYLKSFGDIMRTQRNWELYFQDDQINYWPEGRFLKMERKYRFISEDFHKNLTEEEIRTAAIMEIGTAKSLYDFFQRGELITGEKLCYDWVYAIGLFARLDPLTIQINMQRAYEYIKNHDMPSISLLED